jgi:hypothetical protein
MIKCGHAMIGFMHMFTMRGGAPHLTSPLRAPILIIVFSLHASMLRLGRQGTSSMTMVSSMTGGTDHHNVAADVVAQ